MRGARATVAFLIGVCLATAPVRAVERKAVARKPAHAQEKAPTAKIEEKPAERPSGPPYERQMLRLAEIMGSLAYLRDLCGDGDSGEYRARMSALLEAEGRVPELKEKLAGAYNRGYRSYQATYRQCTSNARVAIKRYLVEGERIAHDISYHFGGT